MTDAPRSLNCPNCGAPLDFPPGQSSVRCRFCDSTIERSLSDLTDDDDAHVIQIDASGLQTPGAAAGPARRFVLKMRNGQPVVIEVGKQPPAAPSTNDMFNAARNANAAAAAAAQRRRYVAPSPAKGTARGCVLTIVAILLVACGIAAIAYNASPQAKLMVRQLSAGQFDQAWATAGTIGSNIILTRNGLLIPGPDDGPDQAVMLSWQYDTAGNGRKSRLIAVDTVQRRLLWQSAPLDPDLYDTHLQFTNELVFVLNGSEVVALHRADGTTAWTMPLADVVSFNLCGNCLQLVGDRLAALSDDGTLEVFDAATGESQWTIRSNQDSPRGLYVLGGRLAFMDRDSSVNGLLRTFDPATGQERSVQPVCQAGESNDEYADWTTPLTPTPDGNGFYIAVGYLPQCLQRWDARSLDLVWDTQLPDNFSVNIEAIFPLLIADTLFMSYGNEVLAVSAVDGKALSVVQDDNYEFTINSAYEGHLILHAKRSRGSARYELWDVNIATGDTRWTFDLGDSPAMEPGGIIDDNHPQWLAQPTQSGLRLLYFQSAADNRSHAILSETLDWQTGQSSGQKTTKLGLDTIIFSAPNWTTWKGDILWMVDENELLAFDAATNKVTYRWP